MFRRYAPPPARLNRNVRGPMAYCPNCALEISSTALRCNRCNVVFTNPDGWQPLDKPPEQLRSASFAPHPSTWLAGFLGTIYVGLMMAIDSSHVVPSSTAGKIALLVSPPALVSFTFTIVTGRMTLGPAIGFAMGAALATILALPIFGLIFGPIVFVGTFVCGALAVPLSVLVAAYRNGRSDL